VRVFGIDPGSGRTGYGCIDSDGSRLRFVACGAIAAAPGDGLPERLSRIHASLKSLLDLHRPDCVAIENLFHLLFRHSGILPHRGYLPVQPWWCERATPVKFV